MIIILSPSKTLDFKVRDISNPTLPVFLGEAAQLAGLMKDLKPDELATLLQISPGLAELNADRFSTWCQKDHTINGKPAVLAYKGDVYLGLQAETFTKEELNFAQQHLRIISGLYGVLRPLDHILPYRLDMSTALHASTFRNLYDFWKNRITTHIILAMQEVFTTTLINLASEEYFKTIDTDKIRGQIITPIFKDYKNGHYKVISFYAKKARGMMSRFIIREKIENAAELKLFHDEGYYFNEPLSTGNVWTFTRG